MGSRARPLVPVRPAGTGPSLHGRDGVRALRKADPMNVLAPSSSTLALEKALGPELRGALWRVAQHLGRPLDVYPEWCRSPELSVFESVAVARLRDALLAGSTWAQDRALHVACRDLGFKTSTMRTRLYRAETRTKKGRGK